MTSSIGWIDFSSEHRDRVRTVLALVAEKGVVDELGIGVLRDTFAPGISTIQTMKTGDRFSCIQEMNEPFAGESRTPQGVIDIAWSREARDKEPRRN